MSTSNGLQALLVYETMFGSTESVAQAVAAGLRLEGFNVTVVDVGRAQHIGVQDLIVVGAPTHAFSLSRPSTRRDAVKQGAQSEAATIGLREWIEAKMSTTGSRRLVAAFDTRIRKVRHLPTAASRKAARLMTMRGYHLVSPPHGFLVEDVPGPLSEGELERATAWGREVAIATQKQLATATTY